jgi:UDP-2,3-diacylglucosamine pyrophosphatase LpxH
MRTLILSDLHLGSKRCRTDQLREVLEREPFERLILNGDTLNTLNLSKLRPEDWSLLEWLREVPRGRELVLLRGNHDHATPRNGQAFGPFDVLPSLLGVPMAEEYRLDVGGEPYLVLHGDQFDLSLNYPVMGEVAAWCYQLTEKLSKKLAKWVKKKSKDWSRVLEWARCQSAGYARKQGCAGVLTGHTHFADDLRIDGVRYVNTGCWTEYPCAYATLHGADLALHQLQA